MVFSSLFVFLFFVPHLLKLLSFKLLNQGLFGKLRSTGQIRPATWLRQLSFLGIQPCPSPCLLSMTTSALWRQSWAVVNETRWPPKPEMFAVWSFTDIKSFLTSALDLLLCDWLIHSLNFSSVPATVSQVLCEMLRIQQRMKKQSVPWKKLLSSLGDRPFNYTSAYKMGFKAEVIWVCWRSRVEEYLI